MNNFECYYFNCCSAICMLGTVSQSAILPNVEASFQMITFTSKSTESFFINLESMLSNFFLRHRANKLEFFVPNIFSDICW
jgi:hypothetical protein